MLNSLNSDNFKLGLMLDCSRNAVPTVQTLKVLIDLLKKMGYNRLELYTEDTYEIESQPYFGYMRGRYTTIEIREIDGYCFSRGIELTPCIQVLAHLNQMFKWKCFNDVSDFADILLVDEPKTYQLIEDMFKSVSQSFTSRTINIGCDEAHMIGLGKFLDRFGYQNRFEIINRHLNRVLEIANKYGFKCSIWSDMYFRLVSGGSYYNVDNPIPQEVLNNVPKGLGLIYWDYYNTDADFYCKMFSAHKRFNNPIEFAGGAWRWTGFAPENSYSNKCSKEAIACAREHGVNNLRITAWGDNGGEASIFSILPSLYYFACLSLGKSTEQKDIEVGFKKITGVSYQDFMDIELINAFEWEQHYQQKNNAEKCFLYNDYFLGFFDCLINGAEPKHYRQVADRLGAGKYGKFSYLFKTMQLLAEVLELKADIGVRTRQAYSEGNKEQLLKIAQQYAQIAQRLEAFYKAFSRQWHRENKPFGFEVQDIRLGGLIKRTHACRKRLLDYCAGRLKAIAELEENALEAGDRLCNVYSQMVSACKL